jgi:hypothetical protein
MIPTQACVVPGWRRTPRFQAALHCGKTRLAEAGSGPDFPQVSARESVRMRIDAVENAPCSSQIIYFCGLNL